MRISMVSEHANPLAGLGEVDAGGQNLLVAELSAALTAIGHEVTVYTRQDAPDQPREVQASGGYRVVHAPAGPQRHVPKDELVPYLGELTQFLHERWGVERPDVVHSHFWMSGLVSLLAAQDNAIPVVHTYHALGTVKHRHQGAADTSPANRAAVERLVGRAADRIVATCADEVFELARLGVSRNKVAVVPCGVDVARFTPYGPAAPRTARFRVVSVGRLVPRKGYADLIAALPAIPDTELVIAGGPDQAGLAADAEARRLLELAEACRVADRVRLVGQVSRERMPELLRSADLVACVPWYEPFGIVPLEAMACAVPVVASAVGGLTDTVVDGITGIHVPPRRPQVLADRIRTLLADHTKRAVLGAAGRDRACSRYTWSRIAHDTLRVYQRAATRHAPSPAGTAVGSAP